MSASSLVFLTLAVYFLVLWPGISAWLVRHYRQRQAQEFDRLIQECLAAPELPDDVKEEIREVRRTQTYIGT